MSHGTIGNLAAGRTVGGRWLGVMLGGMLGALGIHSLEAATAAGLQQTLRAGGKSDSRVARMPALYVEEGNPVSPFLKAGPFVSIWEGELNLKINDYFVFSAAGRGSVSVELNGEEVLIGRGPRLEGIASGEVDLKKGANPIRIVYRSPTRGAAEFRLYWWNPLQPREPLPPEALSFDPEDPALEQGNRRRLGRDALATGRCLLCHRPERPLPSNAMEELNFDAPELSNAGSRLHRRWIAEWLAPPEMRRSDARMPRVLTGDPGQVEADARDIAAFLGTLAAEENTAPPPPGNASTGAELFQTLGCLACHIPPDESADPDDTDPRTSLEHIAAKWKPGALVQFLLDPTRRYTWIRMPHFRLSRNEAEDLAAYLAAEVSPPPKSTFPGGDPERGRMLTRDLGCLNCHTITGENSRLQAPSLAAISRQTEPAGCLAETGSLRVPHPIYEWDAERRRAVVEFLNADLDSLGRTVWPEFAERQIAALQCTACHLRDGQGDRWSILAPPPPSATTNYEDYEGGSTAIPEEDLIDDFGNAFVEEPESPGTGELAVASAVQSRPPLTWSGEKFHVDWLESCLAGSLSYKPRPRLPARMPGFPAYARGLALGMARQHGFPIDRPERPPIDPDLVEAGRRLTEIDKLGCHSCHDLGDRPALGGASSAEAINFRYIPDRLRRHYYNRFVQDPIRLVPGIMMPKFTDSQGKSPYLDLFEGNADKQFEAIWHFMRSLQK